VTSPTRQATLDDYTDHDSDCLRADAIAAALDFADGDESYNSDDDDDDDDDDGETDLDVETLGMTNERQNEIKGSLFRMLGHENRASPPQHRAVPVSSSENGVTDGVSVSTSSDEKVIPE
jgi:hypothetical protein